MRRLGLSIGVLSIVGALCVTAGPGVFAQDGSGPNLVVSAAAEPPTFELAGGRFTMSFTVANEGNRSAPGSIARTFLSVGRQRGSDDVRLTGDRRIIPLRAGRQISTRVTLGIPASLPRGEYFLIVCVDPGNTIDETIDDDNCSFSGQRIGINVRAGAGPAGPPGPAGPAGPAGAQGAAGAGDTSTIVIPRTTLDTGVADKSDVRGANDPQPDANADEGSTSTKVLLEVGPYTFVGLCREGLPGRAFDNEGEGIDEAKILVFHDDENGTMAFSSHMGRRANIPAGEGFPGREGATGGEGKHQIVATFRDTNEGMSGRADDVDVDSGFSQVPDDSKADDDNTNLVSGFQAASSFIAHSSGFDLRFTGFAGIDILGFGTPDNFPGQQYPDTDPDKAANTDTQDNIQDGVEDDKCVFGGAVTVVR